MQIGTGTSIPEIAVLRPAGGGGPPSPPGGFIYLMDPDGSRLTDEDGAYLMETI